MDLKTLAISAFAALAALPAAIPPANAGEDMPALSSIVGVSLLSGWQEQNGDRFGALRVTLAPGWKTYWRIGGDNGLPPVFDWSDSVNLKEVSYLWPRPEIIETGGVTILGYRHELVLPILFRPIEPDKAIFARAELELGVCRDICLPVQLSLRHSLDSVPGAERMLIEMALADLPVPATDLQLASPECALSPSDFGYRLSARVRLPRTGGAGREMLIIETSEPGLWTAVGETRRDGDMLEGATTIGGFQDQPHAVDPTALRLTVLSDDRAIDFSGCQLD